MFGDSNYFMFVNANGFITFNGRLNIFGQSLSFLLDFYFGYDVVVGLGLEFDPSNVKYDVFDITVDGTSSQLDDISKLLSDENEDARELGFEAYWAIVASFENVYLMDDLTQYASFQIILATDGTHSFSATNYRAINIKSSLKTNSAPVGIRTRTSLFKAFASNLPLALQLHNTQNDNSNFLGLFTTSLFTAFRRQTDTTVCVRWIKQQPVVDSSTRKLLEDRCPCSRYIARRTLRFNYVSYYYFGGFWQRKFCYFGRVKRRSRDGLECCYRNGYIANGPEAGTLLPNVYSRGRRFRALYEKEWFGLKCCIQSDMCDFFRTVRPSPRRCIRIYRIRQASMFGDPHIKTPDGLEFTFNGLGEYILMDGNNNLSGDDYASIQLHAITSLALDKDNKTINATVFTSFAAKDHANETMQVDINRFGSNDKMLIYMNGVEITEQFDNAEDYDSSEDNPDSNLSFTRDNKTLTVQFSSGIGLSITPSKGLLNIGVEMNEDFLNKGMVGLFGNYNNISNDDFVLPNGTSLDPSKNYTEEEIFYQFGQHYLVKPKDTLFVFQQDDTAADYYHPNFVPIFVDSFNASTLEAAKAECGGEDAKKSCIFDFLSTGNKELAQESGSVDAAADQARLEAENIPPTLSGDTNFTFTVGKTSSLTFVASDTGPVTISLAQFPTTGFNQSVSGTSLTINWTPNDTNAQNISVIATDNLDLDAPPIDLVIFLCSECSGQGTCGPDVRVNAGNTENFRLRECVCNTGWSGDDCEIDTNACLESPCASGQNCTDLTPDEEVAQNKSFNCTECPSGFTEINTRCRDIDECAIPANNNCDQNCTNTIGGYTCFCQSGYRLSDPTTCIDINECLEETDGCQQNCKNRDGGFSCECIFGYELHADMKQCEQVLDLCAISNKTCAYACSNSSGSVECVCEGGYRVANDQQSCVDINECDGNICSQGCTNSNGSYACSCFDGFQLADDKVTCNPCPLLTWGPGCANQCSCNNIGSTGCVAASGCACRSGYEGSSCATDINECERTPTICGTGKLCRNIRGSYQCYCRPGFELVNNECVNIDECADASLNNCSDSTSTCMDTDGGYTCSCKTGYNQDTLFVCTDINECDVNSDGCSHECKNKEGSYTCLCFDGFVLGDDRRSCVKLRDPCESLTSVNCSYGCLVVNQSPVCYCDRGFELKSDLQTCIDVNECLNDTLNKCSNKDTCLNLEPGFKCSCPDGFKLENDARTCSVCDEFHWGPGCLNNCSCGIGAERCDNTRGCICNSGWNGDKCDSDADECNQGTPCGGANVDCINVPGSFRCQCKDGFTNTSGTCQDIDECVINTDGCSQICNNTVGSFTCSCNVGFILDSDGKTCKDINECTTERSQCAQTCLNTVGSYICSCLPGYVLDPDNRQTCSASVNCSANATCTQNCAVVNFTDVCSCEAGFELKDSFNCTNVNECQTLTPCGQNCTDLTPGYSCSCNSGYKLAADEVSCIECTEGTFGDNCAQTCDCITTNGNTQSCNKTSGSCTCNSGWEGEDCGTDINECNTASICPAFSKCSNTNGSFVCNCQDGYVLSASGTCDVCRIGTHGTNCQSQCTCVTANHVSCNTTNGVCTCRDGWEGTNCETDINECTVNPNICGSNSNCTNTNGSHTCECKTGYEKANNGSCIDIKECDRLPAVCIPTADCTEVIGSFNCTCKTGYIGDGKVCAACTGFTYGSQCSSSCSCNQTNSVDCDGVTGSCNCKTGWTGVNCMDDINECNSTSNPHNCTAETTCKNTDGSFSCLCKPGYSGIDSTCTACTNFTYGDQCSNPCSCNQTNSVDCDGFNGTCNCKPEWTGVNCMDDINECNSTSSPHNCTSEADCENTDGSFSCVCKPGYSGNDPKCTACTGFRYGDQCSSTCSCNETNSVDCDGFNGTCNCKTGWTGVNCTDDINECNSTSNPHNCPAEADCGNTDGSFSCVCKPGYSGDGTTCTECPAFEYGTNCSSPCTCVTGNTASCDRVTGVCTCNTGWNDTNCDNNINECLDASLNNCTSLQRCVDTNGSFDCQCLHGTLSSGTCLEPTTTLAPNTTTLLVDVVYTLEYNISDTVDLTNPGDPEYIILVQNLTAALIFIYRDVPGFITVVIGVISRGSTIVPHTVATQNTNAAAAGVTNVASNVANGNTNVPLFNNQVPASRVTIATNGQPPTVLTSDRCTTLATIGSCPQHNYQCLVIDGSATCVPTENTGGFNLIVGLGVGIPLFFLAVVVIVIMCIYCKKYREKAQPELDRTREEAGFMGSGVIPKFGSWGRPAYYSPAGWGDGESVESSDTDDSRRRRRRGEQFDTNGKDYYMYDNGAMSNFSWDFMYNYVDPKEQYKIKRPATTPRANPVFDKN